LNVPLRAGINDMCYKRIFTKVLQAVLKRFRPTAIVMQCGCDTLAEDPLGGRFNLTTRGIACCVVAVLKLGIPTLLLGGGGYDPKSVARCWTLLTAAAAQIALNQQIPEHEYSERYAPSFELHTKAHPTRPNANKKVDMAKLSSDIRMYLLKMDRRSLGGEEGGGGGVCGGKEESREEGRCTKTPLHPLPKILATSLSSSSSSSLLLTAIENNLDDNDHDGKRKRRREERKGTISADKNKAARTTEVVITTTTAKSEVAASRIRKLETS